MKQVIYTIIACTVALMLFIGLAFRVTSAGFKTEVREQTEMLQESINDQTALTFRIVCLQHVLATHFYLNPADDRDEWMEHLEFAEEVCPLDN